MVKDGGKQRKRPSSEAELKEYYLRLGNEAVKRHGVRQRTKKSEAKKESDFADREARSYQTIKAKKREKGAKAAKITYGSPPVRKSTASSSALLTLGSNVEERRVGYGFTGTPKTPKRVQFLDRTGDTSLLDSGRHRVRAEDDPLWQSTPGSGRYVRRPSTPHSSQVGSPGPWTYEHSPGPIVARRAYMVIPNDEGTHNALKSIMDKQAEHGFRRKHHNVGTSTTQGGTWDLGDFMKKEERSTYNRYMSIKERREGKHHGKHYWNSELEGQGPTIDRIIKKRSRYGVERMQNALDAKLAELERKPFQELGRLKKNDKWAERLQYARHKAYEANKSFMKFRENYGHGIAQAGIIGMRAYGNYLRNDAFQKRRAQRRSLFV